MEREDASAKFWLEPVRLERSCVLAGWKSGA
ncbi:MAG: hypothetical protein ACLQVN_12305 [Bryobacteraceae bacterium]